MNHQTRILSFTIAFFTSIFCVKAMAQVPGKIKQSGQVLLPNGWKLSPAGRSLPLGDLPLNLQLSKSGKLLAVTNNGQSTQSIQLIDPQKEKILDEKEITTSWYGLAFSNDEKHLYASAGNENCILDYEVKNSKLKKADTITLGAAWPKEKICPTGIAVNKDNSRMYTVTKEDSSIYVIDLASRKTLKKIQLTTIAYSCVLSPDERTLYVSLWGGEEVVAFNTASQTITATITTGSHPNELLLNKKGTLLYVANANDNSVSVVNTATNKVVETLSTTLYPTHLTGSTTNGLALSGNEKTLYIANADNNCLAVFDVSATGNSKSQGFIPVGWYPTNVKVAGNKILVSNGKGLTSMANPGGPQPLSKFDNSGYQTGSSANSRLQYIAGLFKGSLSLIDIPTADQLKSYTKQVYANTFYQQKNSVGRR
jgi:YVTN family beta-propeller protein